MQCPNPRTGKQPVRRQALGGLARSTARFPGGGDLYDAGGGAQFPAPNGIGLSNPGSLLARVVASGDAQSIERAPFAWDCPAAAGAITSTRELLEDGSRVSLVHQGAAIYYNLMLAEANEDEKGREEFKRRMRE